MDYNELHEKDIKHLWHPYTEISSFEEMGGFPIIERAEGIYLYKEGHKMLDAIASWWCVNLGHTHPRLVQAIVDQAGKLQNSILGSLSHEPAILLADELAKLAPEGLDHVFFAGDGASAVEVSLKVAIQYWVNINVPGKKKFIGLAEGYHGDTLGAISVGYVDTFHKDFKELLFDTYRAPSPHCAQCPKGQTPGACNTECFEDMEQLIAEHHEELAGVILEPLCQGAGGIRIYPTEYLQKLRKACDKYNVILIADEIAVGFGRTGAMFACELAGISPDIMTVGKGLTGGYLPMSASIVSSKLYETFKRDGDRTRTLYHGHTYGGNPITSALALEAIKVYKEEKVVENLGPKIRLISDGMKEIGEALDNSYTDSLGMIGMVELNEKSGGATRAREVALKAIELGLFIRPLGNVLYVWPPLVITEEQIRDMFRMFKEAVEGTV